METKYYFECTTCGKTYSPDEVTYVCPECEKASNPDEPPKGILKTVYNYEKIKSSQKKDKLFEKLRRNEFVDLLPISSPKYFSMLKVGKTPLYNVNKIDNNKVFGSDHNKVSFIKNNYSFYHKSLYISIIS